MIKTNEGIRSQTQFKRTKKTHKKTKIIAKVIRLNAFPLRLDSMLGCLSVLHLCYIVLEVLATDVRQERERKAVQTRRNKTLPISNGKIVYIENPKNSNKYSENE